MIACWPWQWLLIESQLHRRLFPGHVKQCILPCVAEPCLPPPPSHSPSAAAPRRQWTLHARCWKQWANASYTVSHGCVPVWLMRWNCQGMHRKRRDPAASRQRLRPALPAPLTSCCPPCPAVRPCYAGGGNGTGQTAKLCNNLVLAVSMAAVSEGLALGKRLGLVRWAVPKALERRACSCMANVC